MQLSVRTGFQSDRVLNIFNMVNGHFRDENTILHLMYEKEIWSDYKYEQNCILQCLKIMNICYFDPFHMTDPFYSYIYVLVH